MTDREMLELAAKAAGLKIHIRNQAERDTLIDPTTASLWIVNGPTSWTPLQDDGQALQLVVKLELFIDCMDDRVQVFPSNDGAIGTVDVIEFYDGDPYAATRVAIVRAAAEIGAQL